MWRGLLRVSCYIRTECYPEFRAHIAAQVELICANTDLQSHSPHLCCPYMSYTRTPWTPASAATWSLFFELLRLLPLTAVCWGQQNVQAVTIGKAWGLFLNTGKFVLAIDLEWCSAPQLASVSPEWAVLPGNCFLSCWWQGQRSLSACIRVISPTSSIKRQGISKPVDTLDWFHHWQQDGRDDL